MGEQGALPDTDALREILLRQKNDPDDHDLGLIRERLGWTPSSGSRRTPPFFASISAFVRRAL